MKTLLKQTLSTVSLPKGISNQINNAQTGTSARTELQQGIAFFTNEVGIATNALVSYFLTDTAAGSIDSAMAIIKLQHLTCDELLPFAAMQTAANQTAAATGTIDTIQSMSGTTYTNYCKLLPLLMNLNNQPNHYFTLLNNPTASNTIAQIAADSTLPGYVEARAIMTLVFNKQYAATILPLPRNRTPQKMAEQNNNKEETGGFKLYPNPANTQITIAYKLETNSSDATLAFYDVLGNKIATYLIPSAGNIITENISGLAVGFYSYTVTNSTGIVQRGKIIIAR